MMRSLIKKLLTRVLIWLHFPGLYYTSGKYVYYNGATISPSKNIHMVKIQMKTGLYDAFFNVWDNIIIEEDVILGHQVMFLTGKHNPVNGQVSKEPDTRGPIVVKRGAWIGSRAIILGGVIIGEGSIVGAGSVVTKSIPDHEFWAGNPARFIRKVGENDSGLRKNTANYTSD